MPIAGLYRFGSKRPLSKNPRSTQRGLQLHLPMVLTDGTAHNNDYRDRPLQTTPLQSIFSKINHERFISSRSHQANQWPGPPTVKILNARGGK